MKSAINLNSLPKMLHSTIVACIVSSSIKYTRLPTISCDWESFYTDPKTVASNKTDYIYKPNNYYIRYAMFSRIGDLGCIRLDENNKNTGNKILIEETSFNSSHCNGYGGSLYIINGEIVQNRVSSVKSTSKRYAFCYIKGTDSSTKNYFIDSSVSESFADGDSSVYLDNGNIIFSRSNSSKNTCGNNAGLNIRYNQPIINYSYFGNNEATIFSIVTVQNVNEPSIMYRCIITDNKVSLSDSNRLGLVRAYESTFIIKDCIFVRNKCDYLIRTASNYDNAILNLTVDGCNFIQNSINYDTVATYPKGTNIKSEGPTNTNLSISLKQNTFIADYYLDFLRKLPKKTQQCRFYLSFRLNKFHSR